MMNKSKFAVAGLVLATVALPATAFAGTMKVATSATFHVNAVGAGVSGGMGLKTAGHAKGVITVNAKTGRVCYNIEAVAIPGINAAHIHAGKRGVDGPVVVSLNFKTLSTMSTTLTCVAVPAATAKAIIANPTGYYVNVHTAKFANGAVRAQL